MSATATAQETKAIDTEEGRALLAKIKSDAVYLETANSFSECLYGGRLIDELDLPRLKYVWICTLDEREEFERQANPTTGYCFECGVKLGGTSSQCGACKEGIAPTRAGYDHSQHLCAPSSIKRGKFIQYN